VGPWEIKKERLKAKLISNITVRAYLYSMVKYFAEPEDSGTERSISRDQACLIAVR
jgi:hypothetical protein